MLCCLYRSTWLCTIISTPIYKQFSSEVGSIVWGLGLYVCFHVFQSINQSAWTCYGAPHPKLWGARNTVKIQQHNSVTIMITMVCFSWCQFCVFCEYSSWLIWVLLLLPVLSITCKDSLLRRLKNTSAYLLSYCLTLLTSRGHETGFTHFALCYCRSQWIVCLFLK